MVMGTGQNGTWILADSVRRALATRTRTTERPNPTPRHNSAAAGWVEVASSVVIVWFLCSRRCSQRISRSFAYPAKVAAYDDVPPAPKAIIHDPDPRHGPRPSC